MLLYLKYACFHSIAPNLFSNGFQTRDPCGGNGMKGSIWNTAQFAPFTEQDTGRARLICSLSPWLRPRVTFTVLLFLLERSVRPQRRTARARVCVCACVCARMHINAERQGAVGSVPPLSQRGRVLTQPLILGAGGLNFSLVPSFPRASGGDPETPRRGRRPLPAPGVRFPPPILGSAV